MPPENSGLHTETPPPFLFRPLEVNGWGLFSNTVRACAAAAAGNWEGVFDKATEAIKAVRFQDDPRGLAWSLVYRSMTHALLELGAREGLFKEAPKRTLPETDLGGLDAELLADGVAIDQEFFEHPGWSPYCLEVRRRVPAWLTTLGVPEDAADRAAWELPRLFTTALSKEWLGNKEGLKALRPENFRTPFTPAEQEELAWAEYASWLDEEADRRLFDEDFGLTRVYIPLRAYVETSEGVGRVKRTVGMAEEMLDHWIERRSSSDALRVVEGDPGAGKSSLARVYAAKKCGRALGGGRWRALYVPLHSLNLELERPLLEVVEGYFHQTIRVSITKPLDREAPDPTLLILDGLDELSRAGQVGEQVIQSFVSEVTALLPVWNVGDRAQLLVLLCGRPVAVDAIKAWVLAGEGVINLLPYRLDRDELARPAGDRQVELEGQVGLLEEDRRKDWWEKYCRAHGRDNGEEVYRQIKDRRELTPITSQPLLNYLVAFLLTSPSRDLDGLPENLCDLYGQLLRDIWSRPDKKRVPVPALENVRVEEFEELLQVIALTAWHSGNQRSIRATLVEQKCTQRQSELLERLGQNGGGGVLRLLLSFFFRPLGSEEGERTYEFTHKSFAEYLVARQVGRTVAELTEDWKQGNAGRLWSDEQALIRWAEVFGPVRFGDEVWEFVGLEIKALVEALGEEVARARQALVAHLLEVVIRDGMPMHAMTARLGTSATFQEMNRQALNCEHGLLSTLRACYRVTGEPSPFKDLAEQLPPWLNARWRAFGRSVEVEYFDLSGADLFGSRLGSAHLAGAKLEGADLAGADLYRADLSGAKLGRANLAGANLAGADLAGANLSGADLSGANLAGAYLYRADLSDANLSGAYLFRAYLGEADLDGADLDEAKLEGATQDRAKLRGANLGGAKVTREQLRTTIGQPLMMPDRKPPQEKWRSAGP